MQRLSITHVRRWQENRNLVRLGHVYQGRYKSFPVEEDEYCLAVARYVKRNALGLESTYRAAGRPSITRPGTDISDS